MAEFNLRGRNGHIGFSDLSLEHSEMGVESSSNHNAPHSELAEWIMIFMHEVVPTLSAGHATARTGNRLQRLTRQPAPTIGGFNRIFTTQARYKKIYFGRDAIL